MTLTRFFSSNPPVRTARAILLGVVAAVTGLAQAQTTILAPQAGGGALPAGWSGQNNVTANAIDRTTYWLVEPGATKDYIITTTYDWSAYSSVTVNVNVATFGSASTNLPLLVEKSADSGSTWSATTFTSATPTSSTYIAGGPIVIAGPFTATTQLRFSANGASGKGVRIQQLGITAISGSAPTITSFTPTTGWTGTSVTITGTNLSGVTSVKFNGVAAASYTVDSATQITTLAPTGVTTGKISVSDGTSTATSVDDFTAVNPNLPTIGSFTPATGWVGTTVTITGTNFTGATEVLFAGLAAGSYTVVSATQITATAPTGVTTGKISVTTPEGTVQSAGDFTAVNPNMPTITSFTPSTGWEGTTVTITGTNFTGATEVLFAGLAAGSHTVDSATQITTTAPAGVSTGKLSVTTPEGTVQSATDFTAVNPNTLAVAISAAEVLENATNPATTGTVTRTGSTAAPLTVTLASSIPGRLTVPITVTIATGETVANFDVTVLNTNIPEGDQSVIVTASAAGYDEGSDSLTVKDDGDTWPVVISQYYEGASNDKYIELRNISAADVALTGFRLTAWTNATTENWKTAIGGPNSSQDLTGITIPAGSYWLLKATSAASPAYASSSANTSSSVVGGFNGNDSVVLYSSSTYSTANIIDAVSFTNSGNEGADRSFYRLTNDPGYNLTAGSRILDFPTVWAEKTMAEVAGATPADAWYLQAHVVAQAPVLATFAAGNGAATTVSGRVTLNYTTTGGMPLQYRVSETPDLSGATWQALESFNTYDVSAGAGTKTVYFQVKNDTGESGILNDTIDRATHTYTPGVLITQYYDPASGSNKYLELTNTSASAVDVSGWVVGRWTNQDAEKWKATGAVVGTPSTTFTLTSIGTLAAGQTVVIAHSSAAALTPPAALTSSSLDHTGNDSLALYTGTPAPETLVDVVSFTNVGNEGADKSFVRASTAQGFDFTTGSNVTGFAPVWQSFTLAAVDSAAATANEKIGVYPGGGVNYATWASANANGEAAGADTDGDGIKNAVEYFMGTSGVIYTINPGVVNTAGVKTITWPMNQTATGVNYRVMVSEDLDTWNQATTGVQVVGTNLVYTLPTTSTKLFVTLEVTVQ